MTTNIKDQQLYQVCAESMHKVNELPDNLSLISLFSNENLATQSDEINKLMEKTDTNKWLIRNNKNARIIWHIYADFIDLIDLKSHLNETIFDYLIWPERSLEPPRLLLFDMDSTFIEIEVIDELARRHGVGKEVSSVTESAMRGELDFAQSLISRVACLKGLESLVIREIEDSLPISKGVVELVNCAKKSGSQTAIVSGGFTPFVDRLKNDLNLYRVKANGLEVVNGQLSGKVIGDIVDAKTKADFLKELAGELGICTRQVIAIGDGANDLSMMQAAGFNLAYHAKPMVQEKASGRMNNTSLNWLVDVFNW